MISGQPLPMPRWVMACPFHMRMALPGSRSSMECDRMKLKFGARSRCLVWTNGQAAAWRWIGKHIDQEVDWISEEPQW